MPAIDAVLFDFGGVFTESPFLAAREAGAELGLEAELAMELCFGPYAEDTDHPWHRLERGARIFRLALEALGGAADGAAYLDDHPANGEAAEARGMHGIVVGEDRLAAFDRLDELLRERADA